MTPEQQTKLWFDILVEHGCAKWTGPEQITFTYSTGTDGLEDAFTELKIKSPETFAMIERRLSNARMQ